MSAMPLAHRQVADHLAAVAGLDARLLEASRLRWVIDARCRALGLADATSYAEYLRRTPLESDALIDQTIVPETRFFRDTGVFEQLRRWLPQFAASVDGKLRILSAPCSTGQEAYSLAATLQEAGVADERFSITAVDVSAAALAVAERGVYPESALRGLPPDRRHALGHWDGLHWTMRAGLRDRIRFERRNLAQTGVFGGEEYHLILCRNLFIYLQPEARRTLAASLAAALLPGGRLVLGTADHGVELDSFFAPLKPAASFAYSRRIDAAAFAQEATNQSARSRATHFSPVPLPFAVRDLNLAQGSEQPQKVSATTLFGAARQHQLQGDAARAEQRCRQALYLDPAFVPALELLATLWMTLPNQRLRRALAARIARNSTLSVPGGTI